MAKKKVYQDGGKYYDENGTLIANNFNELFGWKTANGVETDVVQGKAPDLSKAAAVQSSLTEEDKKAIAQSQTQAAAANAQAAQWQALANTGPQLQFNPVVETYVDAAGNPVPKGTPGATQKVALRDEYKSAGPEKFVESERNRLGLEKAGAIDDVQRQIMQGQAQARAGMATRGGLRGQNQALLSRFSMRDALAARQGVGRDYANKQAELESGANKLQMGVNDKNLNTLLGSVQGVNEFELRKWNKNKEVEASKAQADATRASGGGGGSCWIISGLSRFVKLPSDQGELLMRMKFFSAKKDPRFSIFYLKKCEELVHRMDDKKYNWENLSGFNDSLMSLLRSGEVESAMILFRTTVIQLIKKFWKDCDDRVYLNAVKEENKKEKEMKELTPEVKDGLLSFACLTNIPEDRFYNVALEGE